MDNQKSKQDIVKKHPVNPQILDILILTNYKISTSF